MVTVDLPGQGTSDPLPATHGLRYLSASVDHLVKHLGTRLHPETVSHMVLVGFAGKPKQRARKLTHWTCTVIEKGMPHLGHRFTTSILNHDPACSVRNRGSARDTLIR